MASEPRVDDTSTILETIAELCRQGEMNLELEQLFFSPSEFFTADNRKNHFFQEKIFSKLGALNQEHLSGLPNLSVPRSP